MAGILALIGFDQWGWEGGLAAIALLILISSLGWIRRRSERQEMLERQLADYDPSRDEVFDRSAWLNIPAEAVRPCGLSPGFPANRSRNRRMRPCALP